MFCTARAALGALALTALTGSLLGCSTFGPQLPKAVAQRVGAAAMERHALDYRTVCLLPSGEAKSAAVGRALAKGFELAGANVKTLAEGDGPMACEFTIVYEVAVLGTVVEGVRLTPFEFGVPKAGATVRPDKNAEGLTESVLTVNAERYAKYLQSRAQKAPEPASFIDPDAPRPAAKSDNPTSQKTES